MTRVYEGDKVVPVTVLDVNDAVVTQVTKEGIELGVGKKVNKVNKALEGKYKELGYVPVNRVWFPGEYDVKVGDKVDPGIFEAGAKVDVTGQSKGKGFAGVVKRWGFKGGPKTHGQSDKHRSPGSIGAGTDPGRVLKGKKMGGRMGGEKVTVINKKVVDVKDGYLLVSGAVPGNRGDVVSVKVAGRS